MKKIAVLNQKGGVGKTTTVANVSAALAGMGRKTAVIDMDPQAHLTIHFGVDPEENGDGTYNVLTQSADFDESLKSVRDNLWLLGANIDLVGAESELVSVVGRETILSYALKESSIELDYVIIDCPPSLGLLSLNALAAVEDVIIPVQPHFLALQGFGKLLQTISLVSSRINPQLKVSAILMCMYDSRTSLSGEVLADIDKFLGSAKDSGLPWSNARIIPTQVRRNIKLAEAPSHGTTIFEYEPNCNGASDYMQVAKFIDSGFYSNSNANNTQSSKPLSDKAQTSSPETGLAGGDVAEQKDTETETVEDKNKEGCPVDEKLRQPDIENQYH